MKVRYLSFSDITIAQHYWCKTVASRDAGAEVGQGSSEKAESSGNL